MHPKDYRENKDDTTSVKANEEQQNTKNHKINRMMETNTCLSITVYTAMISIPGKKMLTTK